MSEDEIVPAGPARTNIGGRHGSPTVTVAFPFSKVAQVDSELRGFVEELVRIVERLRDLRRRAAGRGRRESRAPRPDLARRVAVYDATASCQSPGTPFSVWRPRSTNSIAGPQGEIPHRRGHQHLFGPGQGADPSPEMDGDPGEIVTTQLALTSVDAGSHGETERSHGALDLLRAPDRTDGTVEGGQESVAGRRHGPTAEGNE